MVRKSLSDSVWLHGGTSWQSEVRGRDRWATVSHWGGLGRGSGQRNISVIACGSGCLSPERPDIARNSNSTQNCRPALAMSRRKYCFRVLNRFFGMFENMLDVTTSSVLIVLEEQYLLFQLIYRSPKFWLKCSLYWTVIGLGYLFSLFTRHMLHVLNSRLILVYLTWVSFSRCAA